MMHSIRICTVATVHKFGFFRKVRKTQATHSGPEKRKSVTTVVAKSLADIFVLIIVTPTIVVSTRTKHVVTVIRLFPTFIVQAPTALAALPEMKLYIPLGQNKIEPIGQNRTEKSDLPNLE